MRMQSLIIAGARAVIASDHLGRVGSGRLATCQCIVAGEGMAAVFCGAPSEAGSSWCAGHGERLRGRVKLRAAEENGNPQSAIGSRDDAAQMEPRFLAARFLAWRARQ